MYQALVENDNDSIGLIAYAFYKKDKNSLANDLRLNSVDEEEIEKQVQIFHDQALEKGRLDQFKERASVYLEKLTAQIEKDIFTDLSREFEKEREDLIKAHAKALKAEKEKIWKGIKEYSIKEKPWYEKLLPWFFSGFPGLTSAFFLSILLLGLSVLFIPLQQRQDALRDIAINYFGVKSLVEPLKQNKDSK